MSDTSNPLGPQEAPPGAGPSPRAVVVLAGAVVPRPLLWWTALGAMRRLAAPGWWARRPHLPLPDGPLWAYRMVTAYGRPDKVPDRDDVVAYLEWCRSTARLRGWRTDRRATTASRGRPVGAGSG